MKKNWLLIVGIVVLALVAVLIVSSASKDQTQSAAKRATPADQSTPAHNHPHDGSGAKTVPAYFQVAPSKSSLAPTLDPEKFTGPTREAYRAVREIPVTIAQLPCYCYCDQGFGHKSLYSCFEDDHAAHCAVCVNEALLALKLEKEQRLSAAQIRETIVKQYAH